MPYPPKLQFAIDNLIASELFASEDKKKEKNKCFILPEENVYLLIEDEERGYSELTVSVTETNLCITAFDKLPMWGIITQRKDIGMRKGVDHVVITQSEDGHWKAHLIEMKTTMGTKKFIEVKQKTRAGFFSVKALCAYLGIQLNDGDFDVYVTYEQIKATDPVLLKAPIGEMPENIIKSEWEKNRVIIKVPEKLELPLIPVKMERKASSTYPLGSALIGAVMI